jgi:nicotinamidase-related amidase
MGTGRVMCSKGVGEVKPALVVVDLQEWFRQDYPGPFWDPLLANTARALEAMRQLGVPIVHVITRYSRDRSDWPMAWLHLDPIWCLEGTPGIEIMPQVRPMPGEPVVVKTRFSGFYETDLDATLVQLGVDALVLAGYSSDVCVRMTAMDAYNRGYPLFLLRDCVHGDREETEASIDYLRWLANARIVSLQEAVDLLSSKQE